MAYEHEENMNIEVDAETGEVSRSAVDRLVMLRKVAEENFCRPNVADDTFEYAGMVHDWRNHVPESLIEIWPKLTETEKLVAAIVAEQVANAEEWD